MDAPDFNPEDEPQSDSVRPVSVQRAATAAGCSVRAVERMIASGRVAVLSRRTGGRGKPAREVDLQAVRRESNRTRQNDSADLFKRSCKRAGVCPSKTLWRIFSGCLGGSGGGAVLCEDLDALRGALALVLRGNSDFLRCLWSARKKLSRPHYGDFLALRIRAGSSAMPAEIARMKFPGVWQLVRRACRGWRVPSAAAVLFLNRDTGRLAVILRPAWMADTFHHETFSPFASERRTVPGVLPMESMRRLPTTMDRLELNQFRETAKRLMQLAGGDVLSFMQAARGAGFAEIGESGAATGRRGFDWAGFLRAIAGNPGEGVADRAAAVALFASKWERLQRLAREVSDSVPSVSAFNRVFGLSHAAAIKESRPIKNERKGGATCCDCNTAILNVKENDYGIPLCSECLDYRLARES